MKRIKLIRLSDKSDAGWDTVNEYISDDLASDSDDDKRIRKAENSAQQKQKKRQQQQEASKRTRTDYNTAVVTSMLSATFFSTMIIASFFLAQEPCVLSSSPAGVLPAECSSTGGSTEPVSKVIQNPSLHWSKPQTCSDRA